MPSLIATLKVKEEKVDEAVKFFQELQENVKSNEPGTLEYVFHQKAGEPSTFVVYEKYADADALKTHSANLAKVGARFAPILDGPPDIVRLDEI
ncbi:MAG: antibiotic biosynthesis monooxygenase [Deltaproteobacteria bacterium]|jgi:quinol monooxygenase YgiN|nr:antibiotic biosynthesis monooxygenase [Deltaproteobacteria bacterium]MBW2414530.1 antibiotic biosynthesis monooxygenase [Deltaproteobacteria bacterium]